MKNMYRIFYLLVLLPLISSAQNAETGIDFTQNLNWQQIQQKAKNENKFIFVDCYATWCKPCKMMDSMVYTLSDVGAALNKSFISVKVQMDTSGRDAQNIKAWYKDANEIKQKYSVTSFPTFLFFSPEGELVHKGIGYMHSSGFIPLADDARTPDRQYYTLIRNYKAGKKNYIQLPYLAKYCFFFQGR